MTQLVVVSVVFLVSANFVFAKPLEVGLQKSEVLQRKGKPDGKVEYETKRTEKWLYADGSVVFLEGRVHKWQNRNASKPLLDIEKNNRQEVYPTSNTTIEPLDASFVREILNELVDEPSSRKGRPRPRFGSRR